MNTTRTISIFLICTLAVCSSIFLTFSLSSGTVLGMEQPLLGEMNGSGTAEDPYVVTDLAELQAIEEDLSANYVLESNIDASETSNWNKRLGFDPIGPNTSSPFRGTLDGQGHVITGLSITRVSKDNVGLFGVISQGSVRDLHLRNVDVRGNLASGGLVGFAKNSDINLSTVTGKIQGSNSVGGAAGALYEAQLQNTMTDVTVIGSGDSVGGLTGVQNPDSEIFASISHGNVSADGNPTGGFVGYLDDRATGIRNSVSTATVDGNAETGGFVGNADSVWPTLSELYWDINASNAQEGVGSGSRSVTGLTTEQMTGPAAKAHMEYLFVGTDFMTTDSYPVLEPHVEDVDVSLEDSLLSVEDTTAVTVTLSLYDGSTTTATRTAAYALAPDRLTIDNGTVTPTATGETEISVTVNNNTDTATLDVRTPANVSRTHAELESGAILENSTAAVTTTLENTGGMPGYERLALTAGGDTVADRAVHVGGHDRANVTLEWDVDTPGTYNLTVGERELGALTVLERGTVELRDVAASDAAVAGKSYTVNATLENTAETTVTVPLVSRFDGESRTDRVRVPPGESVHAVEVTAAEPTNRTVRHAISLGNATREANTTVLDPATLTLTDLTGPASAQSGETVTLAVNVTNTGGVAGSTTVTFEGGDGRQVRENVTVDPGHSRQVTATVTVRRDADATGDTLTYRARTDRGELSGTLAVETVADEQSTTDETTTRPTGDSTQTSPSVSDDRPRNTSDGGPTTTSGPGFGGLTTLVAILSGVALVVRRPRQA